LSFNGFLSGGDFTHHRHHAVVARHHGVVGGLLRSIGGFHCCFLSGGGVFSAGRKGKSENE
jgi:hypothetical protein